MHWLLPWLLMAQAATFPILAPGAEVRLVSPDLLEIHATGRVEDGMLVLSGDALPVGLEVRVLVFQPDVDDADRAAVAAGAAAIPARVHADGILVATPSGAGRLLGTILAEQGIALRLPGDPLR
ncbi:MAG: hypothetical protein U5J97_11785 [Trueperaceae bacterium]|nr:hypothetical protein [Trueperaceae bacterium]